MVAFVQGLRYDMIQYERKADETMGPVFHTPRPFVQGPPGHMIHQLNNI